MSAWDMGFDNDYKRLETDSYYRVRIMWYVKKADEVSRLQNDDMKGAGLLSATATD
jgi:hypothetical protein